MCVCVDVKVFVNVYDWKRMPFGGVWMGGESCVCFLGLKIDSLSFIECSIPGINELGNNKYGM